MSDTQCPVCFTPLEIRDVTPCFICGGWPEIVERFDPKVEFREWRLPSGQVLVLCHACELEEFMVPGGWGWRLGLGFAKLPLNALTPIKLVSVPAIHQDKFCKTCNLRPRFLEIVAASK